MIFFAGSCFIYIARDIDNLLPETEKPKILQLVYAFFVVTFMVATQDIVVDGWALTMLKKFVSFYTALSLRITGGRQIFISV